MKIRYALALSILPILGGFAVAGLPPTAPKLPSADVLCPAPSSKDCLTDGYLDSACGLVRKAECKPFIEQAFAADPGRASATSVKMLRPGGTDIPADLKDGVLRKAYSGPSKRSRISLKGKNLLERSGLIRAPRPADPDPSKAHRNPKWDKNKFGGQQVTSCEEFAYEQVYDWGRYTDAAAACGKDRFCQIDMALLPTTPGIADRKLERKDGAPLQAQFYVKTAGSLHKNDMFIASGFVYVGGKNGVAKTPELDALLADMTTGAAYYKFGCDPKSKAGTTAGTAKSGTPCSDNTFASEWDYHRALRKRNGTVSAAEFAEYARRKTEFRALLSQWYAAANAENAAIVSKAPKNPNAWVSPLDMVSRDPIERLGRMNAQMQSVRKSGKALIKQLGPAKLDALPGGGLGKPVGVGGQAPSTGSLEPDHRPTAATSVFGMMAMPPKVPSSKTLPKPPKSKDASVCLPKNFAGVAVYETLGVGPISCRIGQFLRAEYQRKLNGQKSCLDLGNDDCDWSPDIFEARFVAGVPYLDTQQSYELDCIAWTGGTMDKPNLTAVEDYIKEMKKVIKAAQIKLYPFARASKAGDKGKRYGTSLDDAAATGDKDWFAAGYDYTLGWGVAPVKLDAARNDGVCELAGDAKGGFGVDAWLIGDKFEVVDGLLKGDSNQGGSHLTNVHAHLRVLGEDVIDPEVNETFHTTFAPKPWHKNVEIPDVRPSFTFWAGPIPITGAAWGELFYGAKLEVKATTHAPNCDARDVEFGLVGTFTPEAGLNAKAQVGVGITGVVSAGIRGMVNLVTVGVPVTVGLTGAIMTVSEEAQASLKFAAQIDLTLATLSGYIAVYIEVLFIEEEWEIFRWEGLSKTLHLMDPLKVELPLVAMK